MMQLNSNITGFFICATNNVHHSTYLAIFSGVTYNNLQWHNIKSLKISCCSDHSTLALRQVAGIFACSRQKMNNQKSIKKYIYKEMKWFITCDKCMIWSSMSETRGQTTKVKPSLISAGSCISIDECQCRWQIYNTVIVKGTNVTDKRIKQN